MVEYTDRSPNGSITVALKLLNLKILMLSDKGKMRNKSRQPLLRTLHGQAWFQVLSDTNTFEPPSSLRK